MPDDEQVDRDVHRILDDIVGRGTHKTTEVVTGLVGGGELVHRVGALRDVVPGDAIGKLRGTAGRVAGWLSDALERGTDRASDVVASATSLQKEVAEHFLDGAKEQAGSYAADTVSKRIAAKLLNAGEVEDEASDAMRDHPRPRRARDSLDTLAKQHKRVLRGTVVQARALRYLWGTTVLTGIPVAPLLGGLLLGWIVGWTGDMLDSPGPFLNFARGPKRRVDDARDD
jgi:hypothetical protein